MIIAVDPDTRASGYAELDDQGRLVAARLVEGAAEDQPEALPYAQDAVVRRPDGRLALREQARLVIERPQVYRAGRGRGDPNNLIALALVAGAWAREGSRQGYLVELPRPAEYKGQVPKDVCHARAREALAPEELARVPRIAKTRGGEDVWDAIVIVLVAAGRIRFR